MNRFLFTAQSGDRTLFPCKPNTLTFNPFFNSNLATTYPSPPLFPKPARMLKIWLLGKKINNFSVKTVAAPPSNPTMLPAHSQSYIYPIFVNPKS